MLLCHSHLVSHQLSLHNSDKTHFHNGRLDPHSCDVVFKRSVNPEVQLRLIFEGAIFKYELLSVIKSLLEASHNFLICSSAVGLYICIEHDF